ncbi:MAG: hypothetical protein RLY70_2430 [Planctomycetota bacterium]|jgi:FkbM family methyltransferase
MKGRLHKTLVRNIKAYFRKKILSNHGVGVVARTKNGLLAVDACDFAVSRELLCNGSYDWRIVEWLQSMLDHQSLVVFVGSHVGSLLIPISKHVRRTVGYEADPTNFQFLKMNLALNNVENAVIHNRAIGEERRRVRVARNRLNTGNSSVSVLEPPGDNAVEMTTLDAELGGERIDLMVMDIEGYELHAMKGADQTLAATKLFYVEYAPEQLAEFGTSRMDFIDHLSGIFDHMYIYGSPVQCFYDRQWVDYLRELPERRGLLKNLLFSNERLP